MEEMQGCHCGGEIQVTIGCGAGSNLHPHGGRTKAVVTASGSVMRGEFVRRAGEYAPTGDELRWALDDVHILDTAELSQGRVGVVFVQGGQTKFKILALENGALALGNTLILVEDEAVDRAKVVEVPDNRALVLYNQDAAGLGAVVALEGRTATLAYTDIWTEKDVENVCACWLTEDVVLVGGMVQNTAELGEAWIWPVAVKETELSARVGVRVDGGHDTDVYAGAWSLCRVAERTAVLCFPRALDEPVGFAVIDMLEHQFGDPLTVRCIGHGTYAASLPTISAVGLSEGRWAMAYGIGWLSRDNAVVKSTIALEVWDLSRYAAAPVWYGCEDIRYQAAIGGVALDGAGPALACSYMAEDQGRCIQVGTVQGLAPGPAVPLGAHSGYCRAIPISVTKALLVKQRSGNGYVQLMDAVERVVSTTELAHGIALSGGGPGETITVITNKPE